VQKPPSKGRSPTGDPFHFRSLRHATLLYRHRPGAGTFTCRAWWVASGSCCQER
jgi:hypothetical protein